MLFSSLLWDFFKNIIKLLISLTKVNIALTTQPVSYLCTNKWRQARFNHFGLSVFVCLFVFVDKFCAWDRVNQMQQWDIFVYHYLLMSDIAIIWEIQIYDEIHLFFLKSKNIWPNWVFDETGTTQTWNLSKNLHDPIFGRKNFTHWKRVNWDYFRQQ